MVLFPEMFTIEGQGELAIELQKAVDDSDDIEIIQFLPKIMKNIAELNSEWSNILQEISSDDEFNDVVTDYLIESLSQNLIDLYEHDGLSKNLNKLIQKSSVKAPISVLVRSCKIGKISKSQFYRYMGKILPTINDREIIDSIRDYANRELG